MKYRSSFRCVFPSLLVAFASHAQDQACPDYSGATPAAIRDTDANLRRVASLSPSWRGDEQFRFTWFSAYVGINGELDNICCYESTKKVSRIEARELYEKLQDIQFIPAEHNDQTLEVYVNFTIIGVKTDSGTQARLFLNQLHSKEEYGIDYTAPQRIGDFGRQMSSNQRSELAVTVDTKGTPSNARAIQWAKGSDSTRERFLDYMRQQCFIPAMVNGEPVEMTYYERFYR